MISLIDLPKPETPEPAPEPVSPYAESEKKIESSLKELINDIRTEQAIEFHKNLYAAMNIWYTLSMAHPDENQKNTYMLMSKSIALLIDKQYLNEDELNRCMFCINYESKTYTKE